jgi:hypothetical protein
MMFQAYVGFNEWELFETAEPELDATVYAALLTSSQDPTPESKKYEKQVESDKKKWKLNSNKVRQALIESLCENKQTKLMAMEFQKLPTQEFFDAIKKRVKDTSAQSLNYHTGILNSMKCHSNEKRMEFADRLVAQLLMVMNLGGTVTTAWRVKRLLNGLKAHSRYQLEANLLEMLPNQTWDTITNQLRQYDRMPPSQLSATGVMLLATKVLTARCVRKKVEKDVAADAAQERDIMAEVVDLRAKDMGVKGAVAAEGWMRWQSMPGCPRKLQTHTYT